MRSATIQAPVVLVVDDDSAIRETLYQLLEDEGYSVAQVADGVAALETLRSATQRMVVLLDVMMPRLDGYGVLQAVAADERLLRQYRYIIMTAATTALTDSLTDLMLQVGAPALIKPFTIEQLLTTVAEAADQLVV